MSEIKTLEQKFLADFRALELENEKLKLKIAQQEKTIEEDQAPISPRLLERPIETVYLTFANRYDYKTAEKELTSERIRQACSSREGLIEISNTSVGTYHYRKLMHIEFRTFPYTLNIMGSIFGIDFYDSDDSYEMMHNKISFTKLQDSCYITSDKYDELYEYGLKKLKVLLLEYADKLDKGGK